MESGQKKNVFKSYLEDDEVYSLTKNLKILDLLQGSSTSFVKYLFTA